MQHQHIQGAEVLRLSEVSKSFMLHLQGGAILPVMNALSFSVSPGECVVLDGPSGIGKSSILKMIYGNYRTNGGHIWVRSGGSTIDITAAKPRDIIALRRHSIGYVSQFLRVIPRVSAIDLISARAREAGLDANGARTKAIHLLERLNVPDRLWSLPPATFSGGEQQRVNIACGFASPRPILLLDEPTASLDRANTEAVIGLIEESKANDAAIIGIFHDPAVRDRVADRLVDVREFAAGQHLHA